MEPSEKILTYEQARELRWYTKNCTGLRLEYYGLMDRFTAFKNKLDRLEKTCELIEVYFAERPELDPETRNPNPQTRRGR